jgi:hypothetical protein
MAVAAASAAGVALGAGAAQAADAIEGSWLFENGQVLVEATSPGTFKGTVVKPTRFTACTHPVGEAMWAMTGTNLSFKGTHVWYRNDCSQDPGGESVWNITSTDPAHYTMRFCTVNPGGGPPTFDPAGNPVGATRCLDLKRVLPPQPVPAFASVVRLPPTPAKCRHSRSIRLRLIAPKADPLRRATVRVTHRRLRVITGSRLAKAVNLRRLPPGRYTVNVTATTASGRVIQGERPYRSCPRR